jgi:hypothetical protein
MPQIYAKSSRLPPAAVADGSQLQPRTDPFGALHVRSESAAWLEEGSYFRACNPTMGTGIAMGIQTSFSDTANVLLLMRNSSATKMVIPHYIRLVCTAAGATTTSSHLAIVLDTGNRYTSGGTDLLASAFTSNSGEATSSVLDQCRFGIVTAAAAVAKRIVSRAVLKTQAAPCWTVGDELRINFSLNGDSDPGTTSGSAALSISKNFGMVALAGQNHCLLLHMWNVANATTAPSWEVETAWWERAK